MRTRAFLNVFFRYYPIGVLAITISFFASFSVAAAPVIRNHPVVLDSIGVEIVEGKEVVIHKLEPRETYYGLSRRYGITVSELTLANNNKALKIGDVVRIPTGRVATSKATAETNTVATTSSSTIPAAEEAIPEPVELSDGEFTEYIISRGETLYTVSKRFGVTVESIRLANGIPNDQIREGLVLRVPKNDILPDPVVQVADIEPAISASDIMADPTVSSREADFDLQKNRYGIREMSEKGVGVWIDDLSQEGASMLALHKTAPVGTVVKITNPMTNHSTFVKVVGKFIDNESTRDAIIVISKSVASVIGILDRRFQVEIAYGAPIEDMSR